jgi:hypothetical protein
MATILLSKSVDSKSEMLMFFGIMRDKKEYEMLQAMKEVGDAQYKIKSFKRQIREIDKNIAKLKAGKSIPIPGATEVTKAVPIPPAKEEAKPVELHSYYTETVKHNPTLFSNSSIFRNRSINDIPDRQTYNHSWKCEKCDNKSFTSRKLLKLHISEIHSY